MCDKAMKLTFCLQTPVSETKTGMLTSCIIYAIHIIHALLMMIVTRI